MSDPIDRQAITEHIRNRIDMQDLYLPIHIIQLIDELPTIDAVEVVRCKECKYSEHWYKDKRRCFLWNEAGIDVFEDGFCNYAERRTDERSN